MDNVVLVQVRFSANPSKGDPSPKLSRAIPEHRRQRGKERSGRDSSHPAGVGLPLPSTPLKSTSCALGTYIANCTCGYGRASIPSNNHHPIEKPKASVLQALAGISQQPVPRPQRPVRRVPALVRLR